MMAETIRVIAVTKCGINYFLLYNIMLKHVMPCKEISLNFVLVFLITLGCFGLSPFTPLEIPV